MARKIDKEKRIQMAAMAFSYLREQGFQGVTMTSIARALNMKRSSLYWYFDDVHAIFDTVLSNLLDKQDSFIVSQVENIQHPLDLVMGYVRAVHDFYTGQEDIILFMFQFWAVGGANQANQTIERLKAHHQPRRQMAVELIEVGVTSGQIKPCDAHVVVSTISALIDGFLIQRVIDPSLDLQPRYELILHSILNPLRT